MRNIYLVFFLAIGLFSCNDPYENTTFTAYEDLPAAAYLKSHPDDFSAWVSLLEYAQLYNTLNLQTTYTLFVPNNAAVERYLQQNNLKAITDMTVEEAAYLAKYHILAGVAFDQSQFVNGVINKSTVTDDRLSIVFEEGGLNAIYINGKARIATLDIKVTNGVIHAIDDVLIPEKETIAQKLQKERYAIFYEAVVATGYEEMLNTIMTESTNEEGYLIEKRHYYTAFAVPDSVYALENITDLAGLKDRLGVTATDYTDPENGLNLYVAYHLLSQLKAYDDLATFPEGQITMNINTLAPNQLISLTDVSGKLLINYAEGVSEGIDFIKANINTKNGVIHEINDWMPLFTPSRVTVLWDLADYADLAAVVKNYQSASLSSTYTQTLTRGEVSSYVWKSMPEDKPNVITYRNNRSNDGVWYQTHNYDHIRLELGPSGWVEMSTPVLIKGKYKVTLQYVSGRNVSNSGIMQLSLDGQQLGGQITVSNPNSDQIRTAVLSNAFEFTETTTHTLRIVGIDGKLLTLDYILFEPVN